MPGDFYFVKVRMITYLRFLCLVGMLGLKRILPESYIWVCSVLGAVLHNIGQIVVACLIAGWGLLAYLPFLLAAGCAAGAFTGICAQLVIRRKRKEKWNIE